MSYSYTDKQGRLGSFRVKEVIHEQEVRVVDGRDGLDLRSRRRPGAGSQGHDRRAGSGPARGADPQRRGGGYRRRYQGYAEDVDQLTGQLGGPLPDSGTL